MLKTFRTEERLATILALCLLSAALFAVSRVDYLLFHGLVEMVGVAVGASIFFLAMHAREHLQNAALRLLGVAFLFISLVSLLHTLAYKGMGVFPAYDANLPTQLWVVLRMLSAGTFLLAPLLLGRRVRLGHAAAGYAVVTAVLVWAVFARHFPDCFIEGQGLTGFKIAAECLAMAMLTVAGVLFYLRRARFDAEIMPLLLCAIALSALAGVVFSVYVGVFDLSNFTGHLLVLFSMLCLHRAVFVTGVSNPYALLSQRVRAAEAQFRGIVENSDEGLFQVDREGVILAVNPAFAQVLGYADGSRALGQPLGRHFPGGQQEFLRVLGPALKGGQVVQHELQALRLDGAPIWLALSVRPSLGQETVRLDGSLRDISARMQMENLRRDVERILQHELRSPLSGITGLGAVLSQDETLPEQVREMGALIEDTGGRILRMTEESLALRRLEEGSYVADLRQVDLMEVLVRVRMWHSALAVRKDQEVRLELDGVAAAGDEVCLALVDERLVEHALSNLLKNAMEAAPEGSAVTVRVDCLNGVRLSVHNQGVVPTDIRQRFFERYATSGKTGGTGLGTHIARLAVRALGGSISFTTSEAEGTTLLVALPESGLPERAGS